MFLGISPFEETIGAFDDTVRTVVDCSRIVDGIVFKPELLRLNRRLTANNK
jgi:hypothetical protein